MSFDVRVVTPCSGRNMKMCVCILCICCVLLQHTAMLNRTQPMCFIHVLSYSNEGRKVITQYYLLTNKCSGEYFIQFKKILLQSYSLRYSGLSVTCGSGHTATQMVAGLILQTDLGFQGK